MQGRDFIASIGWSAAERPPLNLTHQMLRIVIGLVLTTGAVAITMRSPAFAQADFGSRIDRYASDLAALPPTQGIAYFRSIDADLQAAAPAVPGLGLATLAGELTTDARAAELDEEAGLASLDRAAAVPGSVFDSVLPEMVKPLLDLARSGPENPEGLYNLGKAIELIAAAGIGSAGIVGLNPDDYQLRTIEQAAKWSKVGLDLTQLEATGAVNAKQFTDDVLSSIPPEVAPALASPAGKFFRDLMAWDQQMYSTSTDGLNLVSQAIATGKLDTAAYNKVAQRLQALGQQGPWTTQSGIDFAKKVAEGIPNGGKLLKALWGGLSKPNGPSTPKAADVPIATALGGQLPPQKFSLSLGGGGGGGTVRVILSPGYRVDADGSVHVGFVKLHQDTLPTFFQVDVATTAAGAGSEEAHEWQIYPEQQVNAVTVHYDAGSAAAAISPGGFDQSVVAPPGANTVTGIDVRFANWAGDAVVLHWPADIHFGQ